MHNKNLEELSGTSAKLRQPELITLAERLQSAVSRFDKLTNELSANLQLIKQYSEPNPEMERPLEKEPESFTDEMHRLISKVEEFNSRLEFSLRHLSEII